MIKEDRATPYLKSLAVELAGRREDCETFLLSDLHRSLDSALAEAERLAGKAA